jgi:hypothetical protein
MAQQIDGYRKSGLVQGGIVVHHQFQLQFIAAFFYQGGTDKAAPVFAHEIDGFGGGVPGSGNKISLIFPVLVVYDYYQLALLNICYGTLNTIQHISQYLYKSNESLPLP